VIKTNIKLHQVHLLYLVQTILYLYLSRQWAPAFSDTSHPMCVWTKWKLMKSVTCHGRRLVLCRANEPDRRRRAQGCQMVHVIFSFPYLPDKVQRLKVQRFKGSKFKCNKTVSNVGILLWLPGRCRALLVNLVPAASSLNRLPGDCNRTLWKEGRFEVSWR
jgi:hypothetical protein